MVFALTVKNSLIMAVVAFALVTGLALLVACSLPLPNLKVEEPVRQKVLLEKAPMIVIATIASNTQIGHEISWYPKGASKFYSEETHRYEVPNYPLQLFKVKIKIENVLRGDVKQPEVEVYYYTHVGPIGGVPGIGLRNFGGRWEIGDREIFYFKKVDNVFRTYCDWSDGCATPVLSGAHPDFKLDPGRPAESIVDLLLTRGQGSTDQDIAKAVLSRVPEHIAEHEAIRKWKELAQYDQSSLVRNAACSQLTKEELPCPSYKGISVKR